jgi:hypothetical protein
MAAKLGLTATAEEWLAKAVLSATRAETRWPLVAPFRDRGMRCSTRRHRPWKKRQPPGITSLHRCPTSETKMDRAMLLQSKPPHVTLLGSGLLFSAPPVQAQTAPDPEATFLAEKAQAMDRMMAGMSAKPSGDVDRDFVAMMVPHHQGAIDMAQAELGYGKNERLRRLAQEIIVTQQQELEVMHLAVAPCEASPAPHTELILPDPWV